MASKKCKCGKSACSNCSQLKLVFLLKHQFKTTDHNPVWYSFIKEETKSTQALIQYMLNRAKNSPYVGKTNCIIIYHNQTNKQLLKTNF